MPRKNWLEVGTAGVLLVTAGWFLALPTLERWHDGKGAQLVWRPQGSARTTAKDSFDRQIPLTACTFVLMSDCTGCSFKTILREDLLALAVTRPVVVVFQNPIRELPEDWRAPIENIFVLDAVKAKVPAMWRAHAPFVVNAHVAQDGIEELEIYPR